MHSRPDLPGCRTVGQEDLFSGGGRDGDGQGELTVFQRPRDLGRAVGVSWVALAQASSGVGSGATRSFRYPGSAGASLPTRRCRKSATAPKA